MFDNVPRLKEGVRRIWGEEEIVPPGLILGNDRPEWFYPLGVRFWVAHTSVAAGAGAGQIEVFNPSPAAGGTLIVVVTVAKVRSGAAGVYSLILDGPQAGTPTANISRDTRSPATTGVPKVQSQNLISNANLVGGSINLDDVNIVAAAATDRLFDALPVILLPQHSLSIFAPVGVSLAGMLAGYEYNGRPEELAA